MVKSISKILLLALSITILCFTMGCDFVDLLGLFASNELNERLLEKDNFKYLTEAERNITPPLPDEFSFIVLTDTHVDGNTTDLELIKDEAKNRDAKFVAILGDVTQNGKKEDIEKVLNNFVEELKKLSIPCYLVLGNHDVYFGNWSTGWKEKIGSTRYRIDGGSVTLFILDSANAFFGKSQIDWLEKELKTAQGTVFVMTHSDLFVQDKIKIQQLYDPAERARVMTLLHNYDKNKMMLMGHSHERVEKEFGDVKYISMEDYKDNLIYCLINVTKTGISREFYKYNKDEKKFKKID